jgi:MoaA/NifB/PqqE/SkfB family radical SAM enzyme
MHYAHVRLPKATLTIFTNGDFLTPTLLDKLYAAGVRDYNITVHSADDPSLTDSVHRVMQLKKHAKDQNKDISLGYEVGSQMPLGNRGGLVEVERDRRQPSVPPPCLWAHNPVTINYRGDVIICCNDYLGKVVFGNLCCESLEDIWSKSEFVKIRRQLERGVYTLDICKKCTRTASE